MLWWVWVWGIAGTSCYCDQCLYQAPESWRSTEGGPEPEPGQRRERGSIRARYQWLSVPGLGQLSHHQPPQHRDTQRALASDVWSKTFIMVRWVGFKRNKMFISFAVCFQLKIWQKLSLHIFADDYFLRWQALTMKIKKKSYVVHYQVQC